MSLGEHVPHPVHDLKELLKRRREERELELADKTALDARRAEKDPSRLYQGQARPAENPKRPAA